MDSDLLRNRATLRGSDTQCPQITTICAASDARSASGPVLRLLSHFGLDCRPPLGAHMRRIITSALSRRTLAQGWCRDSRPQTRFGAATRRGHCSRKSDSQDGAVSPPNSVRFHGMGTGSAAEASYGLLPGKSLPFRIAVPFVTVVSAIRCPADYLVERACARRHQRATAQSRWFMAMSSMLCDHNETRMPAEPVPVSVRCMEDGESD